MRAQGAIPPIIKNALDSRIGYILMVTGKSCLGKNLFSREILREYEDSFLIMSSADFTTTNEHSDLPTSISRFPDYELIPIV